MTGIADPIFGVDVSYAQCGPAGADGLRPNRIDWSAALEDGIRFAIIRATYGTKVDSGWAAQRRAAAKVDGLQLGAYHCLSPASVVSPAAQADAFVAAVGDTDGYLLMLDVEKVCAGRGPDVRAFAARLAELRPEHPLLMYAPDWWWARIGDPQVDHLGPLVASWYVGVADPDAAYPYRLLYKRVPLNQWAASHGGWTSATFLQYTSNGKIGGYPKRVDVDAFRGTQAELEALGRDHPEVPMQLNDCHALTGRATVDVDWRAWRVSDDKPVPVKAGQAFDVLGDCRYHASSSAPDGFLGYLVRNGPAGELHVLPSKDVSTFVPLPADPAVLTATRQAEYDRVVAASKITPPARPA